MKKSRYLALGALTIAAATLLVGCGGGGSSSPIFSRSPVSHVYTQSNAPTNQIINFKRNSDGSLEEVERVNTGGAGANGKSPVTGQPSIPDSLFAAGAVRLSPDHKLLFAVNAGDNTVSAFSVSDEGRLKLAGQTVTGGTSAPKSVSYDANSKTLFVLHEYGPNHITALRVAADGSLQDTGARYSVNTATANNRVPTQITVSPDGKFVLVNVLFDAPVTVGPSGPVLTPANASKPDGLFVFPLNAKGELGTPIVNDAGGPTPFSLAFLNGSNTQFVNTLAAASGAVLSTLGADGKVTSTKVANVDLTRAPAGPSETCWVALSPDNKWAYTTNFGLGNVSSFAVGDNSITLKNGEAAFEVGNGQFKALAGIPTSGPADNWASADGYFYQLYANASTIVSYKMDGANLTVVGRNPIPLNSTIGLAGF